MKALDFADVFVGLGAAAVLGGALLYDWRLALIIAGLMVMVVGIARSIIRYEQRRH